MQERLKTNEKLFEGIKVYYSGSIKGAPELDPDFAWNLVQFMKEGGADVLSEHVAGRNKDEMDRVRAEKLGITVEAFRGIPREVYVRDIIRKQDLEWVDQATHMVALVNAPSHGVGMELQEAILKPRLGLNQTPILCLIHEDVYNNLSGMVAGVSEQENPEFYVKKYKTLQEAKDLVSNFLTGSLQK
ncbi:MAG: hypothetical protein HYV90_02670 [Candidatus Woesebacteria bacterium]|nr:MAG: hypothetical protein HYV90_02670 [Candidatus Woesebacteria bacterium]